VKRRFDPWANPILPSLAVQVTMTILPASRFSSMPLWASMIPSIRKTRPIRIWVAGTGPGISSHNLDRLFQSFFTTKDRGMGIGLAICRSIIDAHGESIGASNLPGGHGARFCFTLPAISLQV
jgi:signal transduction histidine kinase